MIKPLIVIFAATFLIACTGNTNHSLQDSTSVPRSADSATTGKDTKAYATDTLKKSEPYPGVWLLLPGQSAGLTKLNENADKVYERLGPPDGGDAAMQKAVAIWYTNHDSASHSVAIYTQRETEGNAPPALIRQIRITSPSFKTADGVGPGSSLSQIEKVFEVKQTEQYKDEGTAYKVYDSPKGIAFEVGPGGNCVAIVIHEVGVTGEGTYLKFRTTNKFIGRKKA